MMNDVYSKTWSVIRLANYAVKHYKLSRSDAWQAATQAKETWARQKEEARYQYFRDSKARLEKERFLTKLRSAPVRPVDAYGATEKYGGVLLEVVPDFEDHSEIPLDFQDDPYYRATG